MKIQRVAVGLAALAYAGLAGASDDLAGEMERLYQEGRPQAAFAMGRDQLNEAEGEPRFDFWYAVSAIDSGFPAQGVFALERLLLLQPDHPRARLELARGYFLLKQDERARGEFERVLATDPPAAVRANIQRYLDAIQLAESRYRTTVGGYWELGIGYDTNLNSGPDDPGFYSPLFGSGVLGSAALSEEDLFGSLAVGARVGHPLSSPGVSLFGNLDYYLQGNESESGYDVASLDADGGVAVQRDREQFRLRLRGQKYRLGGDDYRNLLALSGEWEHAWTPRALSTLFVQYADLEYPDNSVRDVDQLSVGVGGVKSLDGPWNPKLFGSLYGGRERAAQDGADASILNDRDLGGLRLGMEWIPEARWSMDVVAQVQRSWYREEDVAFRKRRQDDWMSFAAGVTWRPQSHWQLRAELGYSENDSNISINDYDRLRSGLTLRYEF